MAKWNVAKVDTGYNIQYKNLISGEVTDCGTADPTVTRLQILEWITFTGQAGQGDFLVYEDGTVLLFALKQGVA